MDHGRASNANRPSRVTRVYLDWAATAPMDPAAVDGDGRGGARLGQPVVGPRPGPGGGGACWRTRGATSAAALGCAPGQIVFTGGGTEALGLALAQAATHLISAVEHDAVRAAVPGASVIPVDRDGVVDLAALDALLAAAREPPLVAVMQVNNETGVIQPVAEVARLVARARAAAGRRGPVGGQAAAAARRFRRGVGAQARRAAGGRGLDLPRAGHGGDARRRAGTRAAGRDREPAGDRRLCRRADRARRRRRLAGARRRR